MKTIITAFTIATLTLLGAAPQAEARSHHRHSSSVFVSGYLSCGTPIYKQRYFVGYDSCNRPIWRTRIMHNYRRPVVRHRHVAPCPPPRRVIVQATYCR